MKTATKKVSPKKVVKKAVVKKSAVKKPVVKKTANKLNKKHLVIATNHNSFWMNDGQILNSLAALEVALAAMEKNVYAYHTAAGRNDFANWVEDILVDVACADALRQSKTVKSAHTAVKKHLKNYLK